MSETSDPNAPSATSSTTASNGYLVEGWMEFERAWQSNSTTSAEAGPPSARENSWIWRSITSSERASKSVGELVALLTEVETLRRERWVLLRTPNYSNEQAAALRQRLYELTNHHGYA